MSNLADAIATEIMDTIERERRINRDDLRLAAERVLQREGNKPSAGMSDYELLCRRMDRRVEQQRIEREFAEQQAMIEEMMLAELTEKMVNPPAFISSAPFNTGFDPARTGTDRAVTWIDVAVQQESDAQAKVWAQIEKALEDMQFFGSSVLVVDKP